MIRLKNRTEEIIDLLILLGFTSKFARTRIPQDIFYYELIDNGFEVHVDYLIDIKTLIKELCIHMFSRGYESHRLALWHEDCE